MTCVEFIERVGFNTPTPATPRRQVVKEVTFKYSKLDDTGATKNFNLSVPILDDRPDPYLRIDEVLIDFTAKLSDSITTNESSALNLGASLSGRWGPVSFARRPRTRTRSRPRRAPRRVYCMVVKVRAVQAECRAA